MSLGLPCGIPTQGVSACWTAFSTSVSTCRIMQGNTGRSMHLAHICALIRRGLVLQMVMNAQ